jgi:hypothetical protein
MTISFILYTSVPCQIFPLWHCRLVLFVYIMHNDIIYFGFSIFFYNITFFSAFTSNMTILCTLYWRLYFLTVNNIFKLSIFIILNLLFPIYSLFDNVNVYVSFSFIRISINTFQYYLSYTAV